MSEYVMVSTGNPDKDREALERFALHDARIKAGNCPNGCGGMVELDAYNAECPRCGFAFFSASGLDFRTEGHC